MPIQASFTTYLNLQKVLINHFEHKMCQENVKYFMIKLRLLHCQLCELDFLRR